MPRVQKQSSGTLHNGLGSEAHSAGRGLAGSPRLILFSLCPELPWIHDLDVSSLHIFLLSGTWPQSVQTQTLKSLQLWERGSIYSALETAVILGVTVRCGLGYREQNAITSCHHQHPDVSAVSFHSSRLFSISGSCHGRISAVLPGTGDVPQRPWPLHVPAEKDRTAWQRRTPWPRTGSWCGVRKRCCRRG